MAFANIRKLSISKAVTPRQPKKKVKGTHQTYYHLKDVSFLYREPLLEEHRTIRVHDRKIKKAETKKNYERTDRLREKTPKPKIYMIFDCVNARIIFPIETYMVGVSYIIF